MSYKLTIWFEHTYNNYEDFYVLGESKLRIEFLSLIKCNPQDSLRIQDDFIIHKHICTKFKHSK